MNTVTNYTKLGANELLEACVATGVAVTVDCQCPGIIVNDRQFVEQGTNIDGELLAEDSWFGAYLPPGPPPEGVPQRARGTQGKLRLVRLVTAPASAHRISTRDAVRTGNEGRSRMTIRAELENALASWISDGSEGLELVEQVFDDIIAAICKRFPGTTLAEAELLLADVRRATEESLSALLRDTVDRDAVLDIVTQRFFDED
jgi:hypothetical protein